ncbi:MAG: alpha-1,6-glucosidase domain-containing protein [Gammaproteobacteria bacterium]
MDVLRSKSLDRNSYNSGDWFNRIDWSYQDNYFGTGLPPAPDNGKDYALLQPVLVNPSIRPKPADIAFARDVFRDLLKIRASSTLFRLRSADDIVARLRFFTTPPTVVGARIDGAGYAGANFAAVSYLINVDTVERTVDAPDMKGRTLRLHPAQVADARVKEARFDAATGRFTVPARTAVVFVE